MQNGGALGVLQPRQVSAVLPHGSEGSGLFSARLGALREIPSPHLSAVLVERAGFARATRSALLPVMAHRSFQLATITTGARYGRDITAMCARLPSLARAVLVPDIASLTSVFLELTNSRPVRVQLERVTRDACRRFHDDNIELRLLCTYFGAGTEWLLDCDVDTEALEALGGDPNEANRRIVKEPDRVQRAATGDVLLLKGRRYAGRPGHGAVHRSPSVEALRASRLVLKIDGEVGDGA